MLLVAVSSSFFASSFNFAEREEAPNLEPGQWDDDGLQQLREQLCVGKESGGACVYVSVFFCTSTS